MNSGDSDEIFGPHLATPDQSEELRAGVVPATWWSCGPQALHTGVAIRLKPATPGYVTLSVRWPNRCAQTGAAIEMAG